MNIILITIMNNHLTDRIIFNITLIEHHFSLTGKGTFIKNGALSRYFRQKRKINI